MAERQQSNSRMRRSLAVLSGELPIDAAPAEPAMASQPTEPEQEAHGGQPGETGGPKGPEPTRYGDWERKGRCIDF